MLFPKILLLQQVTALLTSAHNNIYRQVTMFSHYFMNFEICVFIHLEIELVYVCMCLQGRQK